MRVALAPNLSLERTSPARLPGGTMSCAAGSPLNSVVRRRGSPIAPQPALSGLSGKLLSMNKLREVFIGRWRITSVKGWDTADVDLLGPAYIEFTRRNAGDFQFSAVTGGIDYRVSLEKDDPVIQWSWVGDDDGSETSGRGWARREGKKLTGELFVHGADEFQFEAVLHRPHRSSRGV